MPRQRPAVGSANPAWPKSATGLAIGAATAGGRCEAAQESGRRVARPRPLERPLGLACSPANSADTAGNAGRLGGAAAGDYAKAHLEEIHLVGKPGEPTFSPTASNSSPLDTTHAGFYKDSFGIVHLQGTVNVQSGKPIFTLPPGFRPTAQISFAASAFVAGPTFTVNRVIVAENGEIINDRGEGYEFISLDGFSFRPA